MSTKINDGGSAFPHQFEDVSGHPQWRQAEGMSLRDWFAGQALVGFVQAFVGSGWHSPNEYQIEVMAKNAFVAADAMIEARKAGAQ